MISTASIIETPALEMGPPRRATITPATAWRHARDITRTAGTYRVDVGIRRCVRRIDTLLILALSITSLAGCCVISGKIPPRSPIAAPVGYFSAGAAQEDITPTPGFPMGGHSIAGKISRGYWTRLFARAIYLEDAAGQPLVLVSCDLWSVPAGLGDRVAELIAEKQELRHIGREQIALAATHTHQSPGNFSSSKAYNGLASPRPGFDPDLFEFLAQRIVTTIQRAFATRHPATMSKNETRLSGFFRNRSYDAFVLDHDRDEVLAGNADLPPCVVSAEFPDADACRAVDPRVTVLRFESASAGHDLIAAAVFIAAHPTVMTAQTEVYSGDLFGAAATLTEHRLRGPNPHRPAPVVALFNGAEGDVTTTWQNQDRRDLVRLSGQLSQELQRLLHEPGDELSGVGAIESRFDIFKVAGACFGDDSNERQCAAETAQPGAATLGGAEDGRTFLADLGFREGRRAPQRSEQGSKAPAFDLDLGSVRIRLTKIVQWFSPPPKEVPIGVYRLGTVLIATLPGEFTTMMGRRIERDLLSRNPGVERVLLVGLANEYLSYFTTPEEYDAQDYEGASTLYGPASAPLIAHYIRALAAQLSTSPPAPRARSFSYQRGARAVFRMSDIGPAPYYPDDGLAAILQDLQTGLPRRDFPCVCWTDSVREMANAIAGRHSPITPHVSIEERGAGTTLWVDGQPQSDEGVDVVTVVTDADARHSRWCAFWLPPPELDVSAPFLFRVLTLDNMREYSPPFHVGDTPRCLSTEKN
jgi:neutral ceramidase